VVAAVRVAAAVMHASALRKEPAQAAVLMIAVVAAMIAVVAVMADIVAVARAVIAAAGEAAPVVRASAASTVSAQCAKSWRVVRSP
jgi:hypothetical protein